MLRELCLKTLLIMLAVFAIILGNIVFAVAQVEPSTNLVIKLAPSIIESGENTHQLGHVGFANKYGSLIKVGKDTIVNLESEYPSIATVPDKVTIPANSQYATFDVKTTSSAGTTKIFASFGDERVFDTLIVGRTQDEIKNDLKLVVNLPTEEMNVNSEMPFSLYLQNSNGDITQAPFDITITLDYEKNLIGIDASDLTIKKGNSYIWGTIKSMDKVGNAFIRASSDKIGFDEAKEIKISSSLPSSLQVNIFPDKVPATLKRDIDIVVSLVDSDGLPTFAQNDVKLQFFSDDQSVGNQIDRTIKESQLSGIIKKGEFSYHFRQKVDLQDENKTITIGAATKGLGVSEDTFYTVKPFTSDNPIVGNKTMQVYTLEKIPTKSQTIAVFQIGTLLNVEHTDTTTDTTDSAAEPVKEFYPVIVNENYDSVGSEKMVSMISSNDLLLKITELGKIGATSSYGTSTIETGQETGSVTLASTIKGIGSATTKTEIINTLKQEKTMIFLPTGASSVLFDKNGYFDLFIISLDSKNRPTAVETEVRYLVTPINEIMTVEKGKTYSHVTFLGNSIQLEDQGQLAIKTIPVGESANHSLEVENTFAMTPTAKIAVSVPFDMLNPNKAKYTGLVQLIDFSNNPVTLSEDLTVRLNPSEIGLVNMPDYVVIPSGVSYAEFPLETKGKTGTVTLGANAKGIVGGQTEIEIKPTITKLKISIGSINEPLPIDKPTDLKVYVDDEQDMPVQGVSIRTISTDLDVMPDTVMTDADGSAIIHFNAKKAPKTSLQIFATAAGFSEEKKALDFDVTPEEIKKTEIPQQIIYAGVVIVAAVVGAMIYFLKKPKAAIKEEEFD
ncbi:MAG: hypothetical protein EPO62_02970 [Candidatus Nitrosotenuis sp.]|nr:MAG: hypothetical protein EPO62_02970 [Candidatus Nitrosotenuis sp.]